MTKVLKRQEILSAKFFKVFEDEIELPTGSKRVHRNAIRDEAVSVFPLDDDYNLYLIDQYRYLHEKRLIEAVAGMVEDNLSPLETAKKELKEEAGIIAEKWDELGSVIAAGSIITWEQPMFLARNLTMTIQELEESEDIKKVKMSLDEAVEMVMNGRIKTAASTIGIMLLDKMRQQGKI